MNRHDIRMLQSGGQSGFLTKPADLGFSGEQAGAHHFHGDDAIEADLPCPVHDPHAAARDFFQ